MLLPSSSHHALPLRPSLHPRGLSSPRFLLFLFLALPVLLPLGVSHSLPLTLPSPNSPAVSLRFPLSSSSSLASSSASPLFSFSRLSRLRSSLSPHPCSLTPVSSCSRAAAGVGGLSFCPVSVAPLTPRHSVSLAVSPLCRSRKRDVRGVEPRFLPRFLLLSGASASRRARLSCRDANAHSGLASALPSSLWGPLFVATIAAVSCSLRCLNIAKKSSTRKSRDFCCARPAGVSLRKRITEKTTPLLYGATVARDKSRRNASSSFISSPLSSICHLCSFPSSSSLSPVSAFSSSSTSSSSSFSPLSSSFDSTPMSFFLKRNCNACWGREKDAGNRLSVGETETLADSSETRRRSTLAFAWRHSFLCPSFTRSSSRASLPFQASSSSSHSRLSGALSSPHQLSERRPLASWRCLYSLLEREARRRQEGGARVFFLSQDLTEDLAHRLIAHLFFHDRGNRKKCNVRSGCESSQPCEALPEASLASLPSSSSSSSLPPSSSASPASTASSSFSASPCTSSSLSALSSSACSSASSSCFVSPPASHEEARHRDVACLLRRLTATRGEDSRLAPSADRRLWNLSTGGGDSDVDVDRARKTGGNQEEGEERTADADPFVIFVNSAGGSLNAGLALFDALSTLQAPVYTVNLGLAASAASLLLAAGSGGRRFAVEQSSVLLHQPAGSLAGRDSELQDERREVEKLHEKVVRLYRCETAEEATRSEGTERDTDVLTRKRQESRREREEDDRPSDGHNDEVTGRPEARVRRDIKEEKVLTAEQACEYGLVDAVLPLFDAKEIRV
ncbi:ATP-dependent Clp endopeptidase, proteolytic subunit ClpP domain-containing protein [Toxoplasma gondii RUB]|uniref:ATP-dependent Clp protease proteolytic subunit n=1 Tax=Toxoplasma gondii RUB TaxID=935652 RepID=A0A086LZ14_TOXGO|nr:ATP-dependent Clp endopeptidase, proteolytic subunit ClpP domain-containing protein [Toxoplasma gondii RUB]